MAQTNWTTILPIFRRGNRPMKASTARSIPFATVFKLANRRGRSEAAHLPARRDGSFCAPMHILHRLRHAHAFLLLSSAVEPLRGLEDKTLRRRTSSTPAVESVSTWGAASSPFIDAWNAAHRMRSHH